MNTTRLVVISDLHLGGSHTPMMSRPALLASFIDQLPDTLKHGEVMELVIAGDFIDFLSIEPFSSWTSNPSEACEKLSKAINGCHAAVFDSIKRHIQNKHRLTIVLGNHDVEMGIPQVQQKLLDFLDASLHDVKFVDDGSAYRVGRVLVEHGNRYDGANYNDFNGLRVIRSALSRNETPPIALEISAGSLIVEKVINPLKFREDCPYHFVDLLQPEGELTVLFLRELEPALLFDFAKIGYSLRAALERWKGDQTTQPKLVRAIASKGENVDNELKTIFSGSYDLLHRSNRMVASNDWMQLFKKIGPESIAKMVRDGESIPKERLKKIQFALRRILSKKTPDEHVGGAWGKAAKRLLLQDDVDIVVMGHTHDPIDINYEGGRYLNTGTWIDRIQVPEEALMDNDTGVLTLENFLNKLVLNDFKRDVDPVYADIYLKKDGTVIQAFLKRWSV